MSLIDYKFQEWGPFSPGLILVSSMLSLNTMALEGLIPVEKLEELLYNPRTSSRMAELGCPQEALELFWQGMGFNDIHKYDPKLAMESICCVNAECRQMLAAAIAEPKPQFDANLTQYIFPVDESPDLIHYPELFEITEQTTQAIARVLPKGWEYDFNGDRYDVYTDGEKSFRQHVWRVIQELALESRVVFEHVDGDQFSEEVLYHYYSSSKESDEAFLIAFHVPFSTEG